MAPASSSVAVRAHGSDFDIEGSGTTPSTVTLTTAATGSTILVFSAAELASIGTPTDNKGNTLTLLQSETYPSFPSYGFRLHAQANAAGGSTHTVSLAKTSNTTGESTLIVLEIGGPTIGGTAKVFRSAAGAGGDLVSATLTLGAGSWRLFSLWSGDGSSGTNDQTCNPDTGWTTQEALFLGQTAYIQAAVATRNALVGAGSYTHTWRPVENQGGIVMIGAVGV
jgi:hypothetical protein